MIIGIANQIKAKHDKMKVMQARINFTRNRFVIVWPLNLNTRGGSYFRNYHPCLHTMIMLMQFVLMIQ